MKREMEAYSKRVKTVLECRRVVGRGSESSQRFVFFSPSHPAAYKIHTPTLSLYTHTPKLLDAFLNIPAHPYPRTWLGVNAVCMTVETLTLHTCGKGGFAWLKSQGHGNRVERRAATSEPTILLQSIHVHSLTHSLTFPLKEEAT